MTDGELFPPQPIEGVIEETSQGVPVFDAEPLDVPERTIVVRQVDEAETKRRLAAIQRMDHRRKLANMVTYGTSEGEEEKRSREVREADVVAAARRSQAEIRRHVDSYLKEHLENIVAEVANLVVARTTERVEVGIAALEEQVTIRLDRVAAETRRQVEAFCRGMGGAGGDK
jgi:hypothetical protein